MTTFSLLAVSVSLSVKAASAASSLTDWVFTLTHSSKGLVSGGGSKKLISSQRLRFINSANNTAGIHW